MCGAIPSTPPYIFMICLVQVQDMSLWCGTLLSSGTTLPLPLSLRHHVVVTDTRK